MIETPKVLSVETIKTIKGLTKQIKGKMKPLGVFSWQTTVDSDDKILKRVDQMRADLALVFDLSTT